jgi:hypothetical protein
LSQTLKKRAAELEVRVRERAETVKRALKEYRETLRKSAETTTRKTRSRTNLLQKQLDLERANAEYIELRKELDAVLSRMHNTRRTAKSAAR